jgi:hypothetical protein
MSVVKSRLSSKDPHAHASPLHWIWCRGFRIGAGILTTPPDIAVRQCFALFTSQRKNLPLKGVRGRGKNFWREREGLECRRHKGFAGTGTPVGKKIFQPVVKNIAKSGGIVYYVNLQADVAELVYAHV